MRVIFALNDKFQLISYKYQESLQAKGYVLEYTIIIFYYYFKDSEPLFLTFYLWVLSFWDYLHHHSAEYLLLLSWWIILITHCFLHFLSAISTSSRWIWKTCLRILRVHFSALHWTWCLNRFPLLTLTTRYLILLILVSFLISFHLFFLYLLIVSSSSSVDGNRINFLFLSVNQFIIKLNECFLYLIKLNIISN